MNPKNEIAFLTTVFLKNQIYFKDFFNSLHNQNYRDFDVLILNDGLNVEEIYKFTKGLKIRLINTESNTPAKNREILIAEALKYGYKYLIFGDSDDYFSRNRVEESMILLKKYDVVVNDLVSFQGIRKEDDTSVLTPIYQEGKITPDIIYDYNIAGMSNTAIRSELVKFTIDFPDTTIPVDWLFFSQVSLYNKSNLYFTDKIKTYYRQHANNTIGFSNKLDKDRLLKIINIKMIHFSMMIEFCERNELLKEKSIFFEKAKEIKKLSVQLNDKSFCSDYIEIVNNNMKKVYKGWWSEVISLGELKKIQ